MRRLARCGIVFLIACALIGVGFWPSLAFAGGECHPQPHHASAITSAVIAKTAPVTVPWACHSRLAASATINPRQETAIVH